MLILSIGRSYSDNQFLFPKEKPSIFKKIIKNEDQDYSNWLAQQISFEKMLAKQQLDKDLLIAEKK